MIIILIQVKYNKLVKYVLFKTIRNINLTNERSKKLLNQRASEGWKLVTYSYMVNKVKSTFAITFKRKK